VAGRWGSRDKRTDFSLTGSLARSRLQRLSGAASLAGEALIATAPIVPAGALRYTENW